MLTLEWQTAISEYERNARAKGSPDTTRRTRREHLQLLARTIGADDPWAVTGADLLEWFAGRSWSVETRKSRRTTFRSFFAWGVGQGHLSGPSPALVLPSLPVRIPNPRPAPDAVFAAAWERAGPRERLMLMLAEGHGLRRAEVSRVHSRDLMEDLDGWTLLVHGKGGRERYVPLTETASRALRRLPAGWAFPGRVEGHLSPRWVGRVIGDLLPGDWTMHKLRHRAGTAWYEVTGGDVFVVQELLGHANPATTRMYVKVRNDRLRRAVNDAAA